MRAERPNRQKAELFLGEHNDHLNRLAETVVCVLRLRPGAYDTPYTFDELFPVPKEDPAYAMMPRLSKSLFSRLGGERVNRFHQVD